jgi:hypothetical protein
VLEFPVEDWSAEDHAGLRAIYDPLAESVRELVDATNRSEADPHTVAEVKRDIDAALLRLQARQLDGAFGVRVTPSGESLGWGNAVIGIRNALAPPLMTQRDAEGRVSAEFCLGAAYEGPPGHVHGGVAAMILDRDAAPKASECAGLAGVAQGIALVMGDRAHRDPFLPEGMTVAEVVGHGENRLAQAMTLRPELPASVLPAFLPVSLTGLYLKRVASHPDLPLAVSPLRRQLVMWWTARRWG